MADPADLSNLRDLALPAAVSWWPPAPGWWIVAAAGIAIAAMASASAVARHRRNAYRREALRALASADLPAISAILKRAALTAWPREQVAGLSGAAWLSFLDRTGRTTAFTSGAGRDLEAASFGGTVSTDAAEAVRQAARTWLRSHRC